MLLVRKITTNQRCVLLALVLIYTNLNAQENSPFSRFGLGNLTNTQHIINKAMGGISVAYADAQSINFSNPASYANNRLVTYDLGVIIDNRTLRSKTPVNKYNSANFSPAYLSIGMPLDAKKRLGLAFGFTPVSRINYSTVRSERLPGIDSIQTLFEGSGGLNEAFVGIGKRWKGLSVGFNTGYRFGKREAATKRALINDTIAYYKSNKNTTTSFGGVFLTTGIQYEALLKTDTSKRKTKGSIDKYYLRLGATAQLGQTLNAEQRYLKETFDFDFSGGTFTIDSIESASNFKGKIIIPATYTAGFMVQKMSFDQLAAYDLWGFGVEYTTANWSTYKFYNQPDATVNSWQLRVGGQFTPNPRNVKNYLSRVNYRLGYNMGQDYINADGNKLKTYSITLGMGLPVRQQRYSYQFTTIHTALEIGRRGSGVNNITENFFKLSVGLCLSDLWFIKPKYD
jgi:hypothetical protein